MNIPPMNYWSNSRFPHAALACLFASTAAIQAHPGHSIQEMGAGHLISSPYHLAVFAALAAAAFLFARVASRPKAKLALRCAGAGLVALGVFLGVS